MSEYDLVDTTFRTITVTTEGFTVGALRKALLPLVSRAVDQRIEIKTTQLGFQLRVAWEMHREVIEP